MTDPTPEGLEGQIWVAEACRVRVKLGEVNIKEQWTRWVEGENTANTGLLGPAANLS